MMYVPDFTSKEFADHAFQALRDELAWVHCENVPRHEYYVGKVPYAYGKAPWTRVYQPQPTHPIIEGLSDILRFGHGMRFDVCFLNRYLDQSDHLGWHSDDSPEMDDLRPIAIVSFGVPRDIMFRARDETSLADLLKDTPPARLTLQHGSLCVMPAGFQDRYQHRIPKCSNKCGERISLTFRGYVSPQ